MRACSSGGTTSSGRSTTCLPPRAAARAEPSSSAARRAWARRRSSNMLHRPRDGMQVLRTRGFESESELAFSGLLEALRPVLDDLPRLPERQAAAVRGALALEAGDTDAYAVYAGTLGLLSLAAERAPLLLLIDDAHWLDRGSAAALAFACRRFGNEGIAALWATRTTEPTSVVSATGWPRSRSRASRTTRRFQSRRFGRSGPLPGGGESARRVDGREPSGTSRAPSAC